MEGEGISAAFTLWIEEIVLNAEQCYVRAHGWMARVGAQIHITEKTEIGRSGHSRYEEGMGEK